MPILLVAPPEEPIALADAKTWLRLAASEDDTIVASLIIAARKTVEAMTSRILVTQSWRVALDAWPASGMVRLPFAPLQGVTGVRVYESGNSPQSVAPTQYRSFDAADQPRLELCGPLPSPARAFAGIEIDGVYGYGAAAATPEPLRQAMLTLIGFWHEHRGADEARAMPAAVAALVAPYIRRRLA